ncbi:MAG: hypothetical protein AAF226_07900, partial [Verrucomicrobiota bacterium]
MRIFRQAVMCLSLLTTSFASNMWAEELSEWRATTGHTVQAKLIELVGSDVKMERAGGSVITVPIMSFVPDDQDRILDHFGSDGELLLEDGSGVPLLTESEFPMGAVHGPVIAGESSYYVYVPKSLRKDRLAPILFYTNVAGGDTTHHLDKLAETSELFGCV